LSKFPVSREFGQRKVSARLPPPPSSPGCRETRLHSSKNRRKWPQFRNFGPKNGPEKMSLCIPKAGLRAFFSAGQARSPVSRILSANAMRSENDGLAKALYAWPQQDGCKIPPAYCACRSCSCFLPRCFSAALRQLEGTASVRRLEAGAVAEAVTGQNFQRISKDFFLRHGIAGFSLDDALETVPLRVRGYSVDKSGQVANARFYDASNKYPAGGFNCLR
jgi:hypothetical protein